MKIEYDQIQEKPKKFHRIHCFTCQKDVVAKSQLRRFHLGHEVHYLDRTGQLDE